MGRVVPWLFVLLYAAAPLAAWATTPVALLTIKGPIGPATADYIDHGMGEARRDGAGLIVLEMDTPGGLDTAMRDIIQDILASPIPVAAYVAPAGARAASAGTYILYAAHIAAMTPGTNLGAATPVSIMPSGATGTDKGNGGGTMEHKMVNDAVAYIRSLAELRGRNADWAEEAVRNAASLSASEALNKHVIDLITPSLSGLLKAVDGRQVQVKGSTVTVRSAGAAIIRIDPNWRTQLLAVLTNPNVAYVLMLLGIYGLFFEFVNPGSVIPGVLGGISLLLALFAFQALPINYAGLALILLGIAFMIAEAFVPSFGALGIGGVTSFVVGSLMLMDPRMHAFGISYALIASFALVSLMAIMGAATLAFRAHGRPVVSGREQMIGSEGEAIADFKGKGRVLIRGEIWIATADSPIRAGQRVKVERLDGLKVHVTPL